MTREEVNQKTSLCFLLNPNISEDEKKCVIEKVMATRATVVSKAALCNIITYILKQNAKLKKQVENRNCSNCRRSKTGCPNDGSCHNFSLWQPFKNPELYKRREKMKDYPDFDKIAETNNEETCHAIRRVCIDASNFFERNYPEKEEEK